jgi:hypothetical protein
MLASTGIVNVKETAFKKLQRELIQNKN